MPKKVLIVGATGYLGKQLVYAAKRAGHEVRALARDPSRLPADVDEVVVAEATKPDSLAGICDGVDVVISALGITRQRDGLTYEAVDYAANMNVLNEALKARVQRFAYVHVLNADRMLHVPMVKAKARFAEELRQAPIASTIINPSGFYSDLGEVLKMAQSGRVYLFGNGNTRVSPISGRDMAEVCISAIDDRVDTIDVGGPETLTFHEVAQLAFKALSQPEKITHLPLGLGKLAVRIAKLLGFGKTVGAFEFFVAASGIDMDAPNFGEQTLERHFATMLEPGVRDHKRNELLASS
ncbi:MAG: SDR family oxidoreductase [Aureliella sp.]